MFVSAFGAGGGRLALLLGAALALRLLILPAPGNVSDITGLALFGAQVAAYGPHALYESAEINASYYVLPPLFPLLLGASYRAWEALAGGASASTGMLPPGPGVPPSLPYPTAAALVKLWAIAADLALGALAYRWVSGQAGWRWGLAAGAAFLFNPGLLYDTAWWGQIESIYTLGIALALVCLARRMPAAAWLCWTAAALVKPQAVVALPVVGFASLYHGGVRRTTVGVAAAGGLALAVTSPFWITGRVGAVVGSYVGVTDVHPQVSVSAYNVWRAVAGPSGRLASLPDSERSPLGPTYRQLGLAALALYALLLLWRSTRVARPEAWLRGAACLYAGFFMLPTQIHERYLYPAVALLCLSLGGWSALWWIFALLSLGLFGNLVHAVPWRPDLPTLLFRAGVGHWQLALLNSFAFAALTAVALLGVPGRAFALPVAVSVGVIAVLLQLRP